MQGTDYTVFVVYEYILSGGGLYGTNDFSALPSGSPIKKVSLTE